MDVDAEPAWSGAQFRDIDVSVSALLRQLVRAVVAMLLAFTAAWFGTRLLDVGTGVAGFVVGGALFVVVGCVAIYFASARPIRADLAAQRAVIAERERTLFEEAERYELSSNLHDALEMAQDEADALAVVGRALATITDAPAELLVADHSRAHMHRAVVSAVADAPGCRVESPWACPAVRRGQTLEFASSDALAACPRLAEREGEPCRAVCVPVTILGAPTGVLHSIAPVGAAPSAGTVAGLETLASQAGSRMGVLRAMARTERQASLDPLTGLLNRRSLEVEVRRLRDEQQPFAVAIADLDHFKLLNDTFGHETGDRALRIFATTLQKAVRAADVVCRYGGEEFVVLFPGCTVVEAAVVVHRAREALRRTIAFGDVPGFTASFGLADTTYAPDFEAVLRIADAAMFRAKAAGRDRLEIADELQSGPAAAENPPDTTAHGRP